MSRFAENDILMREAMESLDAQGIRFKKPTAFQLKVGLYSFYPGKGTIYLDGAPQARPERGLERFLELVQRATKSNSRSSKPDRSGAPANQGFHIRDAMSGR